jgi:multiple sugar transport system substrate-binding protein
MKKLILFCVVILAFLVLFNCQGYAGRTKITLFETDSSEESKIIIDLVSKFEKTSPYIKVDYERIPQRDIVQKVVVSAMAGDPPDVFSTTAFDAPFLISAEIVKPLDNLLGRSKINIDDFIARLVEAFRFRGQIYGIPKKFDSLALFYKRDLFQSAQVPEATDNWNWDDLRNAARRLMKRGIKYSIMFSDPVQNFLPFAFANGASILNEENTKALINSPEAVEALGTAATEIDSLIRK